MYSILIIQIWFFPLKCIHSNFRIFKTFYGVYKIRKNFPKTSFLCHSFKCCFFFPLIYNSHFRKRFWRPHSPHGTISNPAQSFHNIDTVGKINISVRCYNGVAIVRERNMYKKENCGGKSLQNHSYNPPNPTRYTFNLAAPLPYPYNHAGQQKHPHTQKGRQRGDESMRKGSWRREEEGEDCIS